MFVVTANSNSLPNKYYADYERAMKINLLGSNITSYWDRARVDSYQLTSLFYAETFIKVAISAIHLSLKSLNSCNEYKSRENCVSECRIEMFQQMCNCTPTSWSDWVQLNLFKECKLSTYVECAKYNDTDDMHCVKERCGDKIQLCERWSYAMTYSAGRSDSGARIAVQLVNFDYPLFEEEYEFTFAAFAGAIGGALGFYLPLDFLGIIMIVSKIVASLRGHCLLLLKKLKTI